MISRFFLIVAGCLAWGGLVWLVCQLGKGAYWLEKRIGQVPVLVGVGLIFAAVLAAIMP
jgi:hypothetical protein